MQGDDVGHPPQPLGGTRPAGPEGLQAVEMEEIEGGRVVEGQDAARRVDRAHQGPVGVEQAGGLGRGVRGQQKAPGRGRGAAGSQWQ